MCEGGVLGAHRWNASAVLLDRLREDAEAAGIQTAVHYPLPIHLMPAYADALYKVGDFPLAEQCARSVLSLPLYPQMTMSQVEQVASSVCKLAPRALSYSNR